MIRAHVCLHARIMLIACVSRACCCARILPTRAVECNRMSSSQDVSPPSIAASSPLVCSVWMHACTFVCVCVCLYPCMHIYTHTTCTHTCLPTCTHACTRTTRMHAHDTQKQQERTTRTTCTHACMHARTHAHTHARWQRERETQEHSDRERET